MQEKIITEKMNEENRNRRLNSYREGLEKLKNRQEAAGHKNTKHAGRKSL